MSHTFSYFLSPEYTLCKAPFEQSACVHLWSLQPDPTSVLSWQCAAACDQKKTQYLRFASCRRDFFLHVLHCCIACLKPNFQGNQFSAALTRLRRRDKGTTSELMATTAASGRPEHSKVKPAKVVKTRARCCRPVGDSARPGVLMDFPGTDNMKRQG